MKPSALTLNWNTWWQCCWCFMVQWIQIHPNTHTPDNTRGASQVVMEAKWRRLKTTLTQFLVLCEAKRSLVVSVAAYFVPLSWTRQLQEGKQGSSAQVIKHKVFLERLNLNQVVTFHVSSYNKLLWFYKWSQQASLNWFSHQKVL